MLPTKFGISLPFDSGEEERFSRWLHVGHFGLSIRTILAIFDLLVTQMLPTKSGVNWPFDSGEGKNRFSR